jgi:hypothetical protein
MVEQCQTAGRRRVIRQRQAQICSKGVTDDSIYKLLHIKSRPDLTSLRDGRRVPCHGCCEMSREGVNLYARARYPTAAEVAVHGQAWERYTVLQLVLGHVTKLTAVLPLPLSCICLGRQTICMLSRNCGGSMTLSARARRNGA